MLGLQATSLALTIGLPRLHYLAAADLIDKNWSQMLLLYQRYVVCVCVHILFSPLIFPLLEALFYFFNLSDTWPSNPSHTQINLVHCGTIQEI
jgi:hypothetical protein